MRKEHREKEKEKRKQGQEMKVIKKSCIFSTPQKGTYSKIKGQTRDIVKFNKLDKLS